MTNNADPDQLASSSEANWSGSKLLAKTGQVVFSKRRIKMFLEFIKHIHTFNGNISESLKYVHIFLTDANS